MKLTDLIEQCESSAIAVSEKAIQRIRYHAASTLLELVRRLHVIAESDGFFSASDLRAIAAEGLLIAEEVQGCPLTSSPIETTVIVP